MLSRVLDCWPPSLVFKLYTLNYNIHHIVRFYISQAWDPSTTLSRWFENVNRLLSTLEYTKAVVCGATVLKYFDRNARVLNNLDICVRLDGLRELGRVIVGERYTFCPETGDHRQFDVTALLQTSRRSKDAGELTIISQRPDPYTRNFRFVRCAPLQNGGVDTVSITVHLVKWEPIRYALSLESSKFPKAFRSYMKLTRVSPTQRLL